jgi:CheY-like chemotaxis protein
VAGGTETVLLCEDEAPLRALLERMLGRAGYRVAAATDAAHALTLADGLDGAFRVGRAARGRAVAARRYPLTMTKIAKTTPAATTSTPESARAA